MNVAESPRSELRHECGTRPVPQHFQATRMILMDAPKKLLAFHGPLWCPWFVWGPIDLVMVLGGDTVVIRIPVLLFFCVCGVFVVKVLQTVRNYILHKWADVVRRLLKNCCFHWQAAVEVYKVFLCTREFMLGINYRAHRWFGRWWICRQKRTTGLGTRTATEQLPDATLQRKCGNTPRAGPYGESFKHQALEYLD